MILIKAIQNVITDIPIAIRVRFECDSSTIRAQHATTRYEIFRALAYESDTSTVRESRGGVSYS